MNFAEDRKFFELTQLDAARLMGRSPATVSRIERGVIQPDWWEQEIMKALAVLRRKKKKPNLKRLIETKGTMAAFRLFATD